MGQVIAAITIKYLNALEAFSDELTPSVFLSNTGRIPSQFLAALWFFLGGGCLMKTCLQDNPN